MRVFVASWFFPPSTSSEAIVTFKLLKNSRLDYDVCSANSRKWCYGARSELTAPNIRQYLVDTDEFEPWITEAVRIFEENHTREPYAAIMTRMMPPESHEVGLRIKRKHPDVRWIASFADPLAINPYELNAYIMGRFPGRVGRTLIRHPRKLIPWASHVLPTTGIKILAANQKLQDSVFEQADQLLFPTLEQCRYSLGRRFEAMKRRCIVLPHSFDNELYGVEPERSGPYTFAFVGYADDMRNPAGVIEALRMLRVLNPALISLVRFQIVGNHPAWLKDMAYAFLLHDTVEFVEPVDYLTSLRIMQGADCLVHVDAFFPFIEHGSMFLSAKLIDYLGAKRPVLGLTGQLSPAGKILRQTGNRACLPWQHFKLAAEMARLASSGRKPGIKPPEAFSARAVAALFDRCVLENASYTADITAELMP